MRSTASRNGVCLTAMASNCNPETLGWRLKTEKYRPTKIEFNQLIKDNKTGSGRSRNGISRPALRLQSETGPLRVLANGRCADFQPNAGKHHGCAAGSGPGLPQPHGRRLP